MEDGIPRFATEYRTLWEGAPVVYLFRKTASYMTGVG